MTVQELINELSKIEDKTMEVNFPYSHGTQENGQAFINDSIHEGMRVLKTNGTLIFKWNEQQIKVSDVLKAITDYKPIFGHRTTIKNQTIWMAFMK